MSLMTQAKAKELLKAYLDAELSGDNALAASLEEQIKKGGWKITYGPEGYTVIRENDGLFSNDNTGSFFYPQERYVTPYSGTPKSSNNNTGLIVGISIGAIVLTISIILIVKLIKSRKNAVAG